MLNPAMIGSMYSLRKNRAQHGGHRFRLRVSTFQGSRLSLCLVRHSTRLGDVGDENQKALN